MTLCTFSDRLARSPSRYGRMLEAVDFMIDTPKEILIVTPADRSQAEPFLATLGAVYLPNRVLAVVPEGEIDSLSGSVPLLVRKRALDDRVTAYVCENRVCELPAREPALFRQQLEKPARPYAPRPSP